MSGAEIIIVLGALFLLWRTSRAQSSRQQVAIGVTSGSSQPDIPGIGSGVIAGDSTSSAAPPRNLCGVSPILPSCTLPPPLAILKAPAPVIGTPIAVGAGGSFCTPVALGSTSDSAAIAAAAARGFNITLDSFTIPGRGNFSFSPGALTPSQKYQILEGEGALS